MKKVAVVIPLYNHERYIGTAFSSLRAQTRPPDRVIIIDDGSTDRSVAALIATPGASPVEGVPVAPGIQTRTDILLQANAGAHETLNRCVALADDCDYIAILNSDDRYHPDRIERCLAHLELHPDAQLLCTRLRVIDGAGHPLPATAPQSRWFNAAWSFRGGANDASKADLAEWLGFANFPGTTSNFFARADYLRSRPFSGYRYAHDYFTLIMAALEGDFAVLDAELLDYRVHDANTIATTPEKLIREMMLLNLDLARVVGPRLMVEPALRVAYARYQRAAWNNFSAFRADLFNVLLTEALLLLPAPTVQALLDVFTPEHFPEMTHFPNLSVVSAHHSLVAPLGPTSGLADKFYALKTQLSAAKKANRPWVEHRQLQSALLESRWFALGRALGLTGTISGTGGKTAPEKAALLQDRVASSKWLKLGGRLGVNSAQRLLALSRSPASDDEVTGGNPVSE